MKHGLLPIFLLLVLCTPPAFAEKPGARPSYGEGTEPPPPKKLYKWIDREGNVSYHDQLPPDDSKYKVEERVLKDKKTSAKKPAEVDELLRAPVVMYAIPKCLSCDMARTYLQRRKVPFTEKNVEGNRVLIEELKKKAGSLSVPTILVGEKVMQGFLESLLAGELDAAGYPPEPPEGPRTGGESTDAKPSP